jgi:ceramide glucosyltransferase
VLLLALLVRAAAGRRIDRALRLKAAPLWLLPVRDLLSFGVFIASFLGRSVAWRDRRFRIGPEGQLIIVPEKLR